MTSQTMSEDQMVFLVRNALLVASQELGRGDEWPVVKDTIHKVMKDWETLKAERNVDTELKIHLYDQLKRMEESLIECAPDIRDVLEPRIRILRDACDAYFAKIDKSACMKNKEDEPIHVKRMNAILETMEEGYEE